MPRFASKAVVLAVGAASGWSAVESAAVRGRRRAVHGRHRDLKASRTLLANRDRGLSNGDVIAGPIKLGGPAEIIGGDVIAPEDLPPYLVSIGYDDGGVDDTIHVCGGSLIGNRTVLTAAHCFTYEGEWDPKDYVEFNRYDLTDDNGVIRRELCNSEFAQDCDGLSYVIRHPDFDDFTFENDIALIILNETVPGTTPVELNSDPDLPAEGNELRVYGWGLAEDGAGGYEYPDLPRTTVLSYVENDKCSENPYQYPDEWIFDDMLCATDAPDSDSCYADSGGPLVIESGDKTTVVGVVSWGSGEVILDIACNDPDYPGVYSRISFASEWIKDTACAETGGDFCVETRHLCRKPEWANGLDSAAIEARVCNSGNAKVGGCNCPTTKTCHSAVCRRPDPNYYPGYKYLCSGRKKPHKKVCEKGSSLGDGPAAYQCEPSEPGVESCSTNKNSNQKCFVYNCDIKYVCRAGNDEHKCKNVCASEGNHLVGEGPKDWAEKCTATGNRCTKTTEDDSMCTVCNCVTNEHVR